MVPSSIRYDGSRDSSQDVCAFNVRFAEGTEAPRLVELMRMTREDWDAFSGGSAIRRAGYAGFKRNVAVAMRKEVRAQGLEG